MAIINILILSVLGPSLYVTIYKDGPGAERVTIWGVAFKMDYNINKKEHYTCLMVERGSF